MLIIEVHRCNLKHREMIVRIRTKLRHRLSLPITPSLSVAEGCKEGKGGGEGRGRERGSMIISFSPPSALKQKNEGGGLAVGRFRLVFVPSCDHFNFQSTFLVKAKESLKQTIY